MEELTPMMSQYMAIKQNCPDSILLFRLGDFYEMFFEDAIKASKLLGIVLTSREAGKDNKVPMAGIPYHAADSYIARLIKAGFKVAICEQVEDPKLAKGIVRREVTRIITPGTLVSENLLDETSNNYLVGINEDNGLIGLAAVDVSTGEFKVSEFNDIGKAAAEVARLSPSEYLIPVRLKDTPLLKKVSGNTGAPATCYDDWIFSYENARTTLISHLKTHSLAGFGCEQMRSAVGAAGAVIRYIDETQKTQLAHVNKISSCSSGDYMTLDGITLRNLELVGSADAFRKDTNLLGVLSRTVTAMGTRLLTKWIKQPLLSIKEINFRLDVVEELTRSATLRNVIRQLLSDVKDIERLVARISLGAANARDLVALGRSLAIAPSLKEKLSATNCKEIKQICEGMDDLRDVTELIDRAIVSDPPVSLHEGGIIKPGFDNRLDELRVVASGGKQWVANLQSEEIRRTGISSLKVRYNKILGYYIEVTKPNLGAVPQDYIRKQTLVNAERFTTPALKEYEMKILSAEEQIFELEYEIFTGMRGEITSQIESIQKTASHMAMVDVFCALAEVSVRNRYVRPAVNEDEVILIEEGRHPVLEQIMPPGRFVPNDALLDCTENRILIVTGPNMAGKSTWIRQVALTAVMAQMGSFVPAKKASIGIVDRIFTRIGAADDLSAGMSTFMLEMNETANILNNATPRSLIILDEIGRGTSTFDGLSIAWAAVEYINECPGLRARTLFATHYHELTELSARHSGIRNYNIAVKEWNDDVVFLYKVVPGGSDSSYGIHVARLAGLPKEVVARAREILSALEINSISENGMTRLFEKRSRSAPSERQMYLFSTPGHEVLEELKNVDVDRITAIEALNKIQMWKEKMED
jgi:DNA mismatch repair protein MutS